MADQNTTPSNDKAEESSTLTVKFCPICGTQMVQEMRYGFLCWVCPECDYDEPI
ncbi:TPA: zf-TFIIB domain-containing protein [Citrobacter murliniae]